MIITKENFIVSVNSTEGISEGIRYIAVIFMLVFLINSLIHLLSEEGSWELPIKSYLAYFMVYFFYRLSIV